MASISSRRGRKRPLYEVSESSSSSTVDNESSLKPKLCGACRKPLESPPLPKIVTQAPQQTVSLHKMFVTCANFRSTKNCNAVRHNSSPHFHFGCSGIPTGSKLFSDLMQDLEKREQKERSTDQESNGNSATGEIDSTLPLDKDIKQCRSISNDREERRETSTEISAVDCNGTIDLVSPPPSRRESFGGKNKETCIQPFKMDDDRNDFLCPFCDVQGSSQYLQEYFSNFRTQKVEYYALEESRDVPPVPFCQPKVGENVKPVGNDGNKRNSCFMDYLLQQQQKLGFSCAKTELRLDHINNIMECIHRCEKNVQNKGLNEAGYVDIHEESSLKSQQKVHTEYHHTTTLGELASESMKTTNTKGNENIFQQKEKKLPPFNATCLVGQPVRLFCSINNAYHVGRIIDWRQCDELNNHYRKNSIDALKINEELAIERDKCIVNQSLIIDRDISCTQFLVRFRAGIEGRKVTVHEWLFLEEHPLMVGLALVWAKSDNAKSNEPKGIFTSTSHNHIPSQSKSDLKQNVIKYRPAQIFIRSALEISSIPKVSTCTKKEQDSMPLIKAMTLFFGKKFHCKILQLCHRDRLTLEGCLHGDTKDESSFSLVKIIAADFEAPPAELEAYLKRLQCDDAALVVTTALASMEIEERRRILRWHKYLESTLTVS